MLMLQCFGNGEKYPLISMGQVSLALLNDFLL